MAKIDITNYFKASLAEAKNNGGYIDIDELVDEGINQRISSEMTRKEAERYYWMRNAEIYANAYGFYSISRGVYVNFECATLEELDLMIDNLDTTQEGYEKRLKLLIEERKKRDREHCEGQIEFTSVIGVYKERRTLAQILADKKNEQEAI